MNESTTDPLSGLPQPNQTTKPSPLKDAGSVNESKGERWWLKDSVQPSELNEVPSELSELTESHTTSDSEHLNSDGDISEPAAKALDDNNSIAHIDDVEDTEAQRSKPESSKVSLVIALGIIALVIFFLSSGV